MKKIFLLLGCIVLLCFVFSACDEAEESKADISKAETAVSQAVSETESDVSAEVSEDVSAEVSVGEESKALEESKITEESVPAESNTPEVSQPIAEAPKDGIKNIKWPSEYYPEELEFFFEDDEYMYILYAVFTEHTTVEYYDGTTQTVAEALKSGNMVISDLDKYGRWYVKVPVDNTPIPEGEFIITDYKHLCRVFSEIWPDSMDYFYEDDTYRYCAGLCNQSAFVIVTYSDGTKENIKEAIHAGRITIADLDEFEIWYSKEEK